jgi:hypothetical protein
VYAPPGRDHEILARAVARRLELPLAPWPAVGVPAPGLIVVYDLAALPLADIARLQHRKPDQILYAHASPWTHDFALAPEVTTVLYETLVPAWGETLIEDPVTHIVEREPADARDAEVIAAEIVAHPGLDAEEAASDDLERWEALVAATWPPHPGQRPRFWAGGPVPSNRFN